MTKIKIKGEPKDYEEEAFFKRNAELDGAVQAMAQVLREGRSA